MIDEFFLERLDRRLKRLLTVFVITLSVGFFTGIRFVHFTTSGTPSGISQNYLGNEDNPNAKSMKFKKTKHEMLNIMHTHFLSMSIIFLVLGLLVYGCRMPHLLKSFLLLEPMVSVLVTFGGIYLLWKETPWMSYIVIVSGTLMTLSFVLSVVYVLKTLVFANQIQTKY